MHSRTVETGREINAIRIGGTEYLLTVTAGDAVHLTQETGPGVAQGTNSVLIGQPARPRPTPWRLSWDAREAG